MMKFAFFGCKKLLLQEAMKKRAFCTTADTLK